MTEHAREKADHKQDKAVEDSFPASDPPANSGIVGPSGVGEVSPSQPKSQPDRRDEQRSTPHRERGER